MSEQEEVEPHVSNLADKYAAESARTGDHDAAEEDIFDELEQEDDDLFMSSMRDRRMEQLKSEMERVKEMQESDHGRLTTLNNEKDVIEQSAKEASCIVHFFHKDFRRCEIMDKHLNTLAQTHFRTRFIKVDVEDVPWLVTRLGIQVLPCLICFVDGKTVDRVVGFEELGNTDGFTTAQLEARLTWKGVLRIQNTENKARPTILGFAKSTPDNEDEWDSDE